VKVGATACEGSTASFKDTQESTSPPVVLVQHLRLPFLNDEHLFRLLALPKDYVV
jgi:hypothetical protein